MALDLENFEQRGQFWYRCGAPSRKAHEPRICEQCQQPCMIARESIAKGKGRYCSYICALSGGRSPFAGQVEQLSTQWKGDAVGYYGVHARVRRQRGDPAMCVFGCTETYRFEWANLMGDLLDPEDYAPMCVRCHRRFDASVRATLGIVVKISPQGRARMRTAAQLRETRKKEMAR